VVNSTNPNVGMVARIRMITMMKAQVRLDSFGNGGIFDNDGIFMTSPLLKIKVEVVVKVED
jgi:hypothetical protein